MGITRGAQEHKRAHAEHKSTREHRPQGHKTSTRAQAHKSSTREQESTRGAQEHRGIDSDSSSAVATEVVGMVNVVLEVHMYAILATHLFQFLAPSGSKNRGVVLCCGVSTAGNMGWAVGSSGV